MRLVLDTNVLVAAMRSPQGTSARLMAAVQAGKVTLLASTTLFVEYESVLTRPEHTRVAGATADDVGLALSRLAQIVEPVEIHFLLRPEVSDANDDMVLELAFNGRADAS